MNRRILVADDSSTIQKVIKIAFSRFQAQMVETGSYIEALNEVGKQTPDMLIIDASLPGAHGPEDFRKLREEARGAPLLLLVGTYEKVDEDAFKSAGLEHFLKKPFESADIVGQVDLLLEGGLAAEQGADAVVAPPETPGPPPPPVKTQQTQQTRHDQQKQPSPSDTGLSPTEPMPKPLPDTLATPPPPPPHYALGDTGDSSSGFEPGDEGSEKSSHEGGGFGSSNPMPLTDETRKGRKAFSGDRMPPPPPPMPPSPPSQPSPSSRTQGAGPLPPIPRDLGGVRDLGNLADGADLRGAGVVNDLGEGGDSEVSPWKGQEVGGAEDLAELLPRILDDHLPTLVRAAVEDYCNRHFKSLARDVIAQELRRLADEKARHLVDN